MTSNKMIRLLCVASIASSPSVALAAQGGLGIGAAGHVGPGVGGAQASADVQAGGKAGTNDGNASTAFGVDAMGAGSANANTAATVKRVRVTLPSGAKSGADLKGHGSADGRN